MAIPNSNYQSGYLNNLWTSYRQRRATGGRPLVAQEMRGLLDPLAQGEAQKSIAAGDRAQRQSNIDRQFSQQEKRYNDQSRAAGVSGATDLLGLGLSYKLGSQSNQIMKGLLGGAANPGAVAGGAAGGAAYTSAAALGGAGAEGFVPGLMGGGAASVAGPAALGVAGGLIGSQALQKTGINKDISESVSYTAAGALAGAAIGGPVGAAVGGAIGLGVSLIDDIFGGLF